MISSDATTVRSIREAFAQDPFSLSEVPTWAAAKNIIGRSEPDLLVVDLDSESAVPPGGEGLGSAAMPVLLLSARSLAALQESGIDPASADYLAKPFSIPQVRARAKVSLARSQCRRQGAGIELVERARQP